MMFLLTLAPTIPETTLSGNKVISERWLGCRPANCVDPTRS